jgi:Uma2 family endonuclease
MSKVEEPQGEYRRIPKKISLEEYWEREFISEGRYEYHDGVLVEMTYTSEPHGQICSNLNRLIGNCVLDKDCSVYAENRMVYIPECNKNFYPDIVLVCGKHDLRQVSKNMKATMNPSVVIEVLSDSTAEFDKTTKTRCYKKVKSIQQIIFVNQTDKYVRTLKKTDDERIWLEIDAYDDDDIVEVGECKLSIKEIYHRVAIDFEPENLSDIQKY